MSNKNYKDIITKDKEELVKDIKKLKDELNSFTIDKLSGKLRDTSVFSKHKLQIARIKTYLNQIEEKNE